jgi:hypothetical protein
MKLVCRGVSRFSLAIACVVAAFSTLTPGGIEGDVSASDPLFSDSAESLLLSSVAVECISDEAKYWRMRNLLLARAGLWSSGEAIESFAVLAADAGLEPSAFVRCVESRRAQQRALADRNASSAQTFVASTQARVFAT